MIQYTLRVAKRFAVLLPGIVIAYFSARDIFPYFDRRLPLGFAVFITYALSAYILVPALIRLFRVIHTPAHLPLYCVTPDGFASDPLNIGIIATRRQLIGAMEQSGWHLADPRGFKNLLRAVLSIIVGEVYRNAPVSGLYLFGRKQDLAFEIPTEGGGGSRHHVRFWATTYEPGQKLSIRNIHWHYRQTHVYGDSLLWVGAASLDVGLSFIRHNMQITHMIAPDTNQERKLIVNQLTAAGLVKKTETIKLGQPYRLVNRVWRGSLHTDGKMNIVRLKTDTQ
jgi:hypothetical protein